MVEIPRLGIYVPKEGKFLTLREVHKKFSSTQYGEFLEQNVRFGKFKPEHVSAPQWKLKLGADVCNLQHHPFTLGKVISLVAYQDCPPERWDGEVRKFSANEVLDLAFSATVHDWPEAKVGDTPYPLKTKADEENESLILSEMLEEILGLEPNSRQTTRALEIIEGRDPILGKAFKAAEVTGYHGTAVKAWKNSATEKDEILCTNLKNLAISTVGNINSLLLKSAKYYPGIMVDISRRAAIVSDIFRNAPEATLQELANSRMGKKPEDFRSVEEDWNKFTHSLAFKRFTRPKLVTNVEKQLLIPV